MRAEPTNTPFLPAEDMTEEDFQCGGELILLNVRWAVGPHKGKLVAVPSEADHFFTWQSGVLDHASFKHHDLSDRQSNCSAHASIVVSFKPGFLKIGRKEQAIQLTDEFGLALGRDVADATGAWQGAARIPVDIDYSAIGKQGDRKIVYDSATMARAHYRRLFLYDNAPGRSHYVVLADMHLPGNAISRNIRSHCEPLLSFPYDLKRCFDTEVQQRMVMTCTQALTRTKCPNKRSYVRRCQPIGRQPLTTHSMATVARA